MTAVRMSAVEAPSAMRTPNSRMRRRIVNAMAAYWPIVAISSDPSAKEARRTASAWMGHVRLASCWSMVRT